MAAFEDAEAEVVGAILLAAIVSVETGHRILDRALETGIVAEDFWRQSLGLLFVTLCDMQAQDLPLDPLAVAVELDGIYAPGHVRARLEVLARSTTAFGHIEHRCGIVMAASRDRAALAVRT